MNRPEKRNALDAALTRALLEALRGAEARDFVAATVMANLVRTVGRKAASALVALGEPIGASRAAALGLVNRVVPLPDPMRGAIALAERLAAMRRPASAETKRLLHDAADLPRAKALALSFFGWDDSQIGAPRALGEFAEDALRTAGAI